MHLVIIRFFDFTEKAELFRNASKLKGTQTYISEDFSPRLRKIRKLLWATAKDKEPEDKLYLKYDKLVINKEVYAWDERKNQRFKVPDAASHGIDHSFESGLAKASQQGKNAGGPRRKCANASST